MSMTNAEIIFRESVPLAEKGILEYEDDGFPEPILSFDGWRRLGYSVMKGEKAIAAFHIWVYKPKKAKKEAEIEESESASEESENPKGGKKKRSPFVWQKTSFFKASQVMAMPKK